MKNTFKTTFTKKGSSQNRVQCTTKKHSKKDDVEKKAGGAQVSNKFQKNWIFGDPRSKDGASHLFPAVDGKAAKQMTLMSKQSVTPHQFPSPRHSGERGILYRYCYKRCDAIPLPFQADLTFTLVIVEEEGNFTRFV